MANESYTLYYNTWSICSQMVRLTFAFRDQPKSGELGMIIEEKEVDIYNTFTQLDEFFLTEINPKGKVPVLAHPTLLSKPMPESLDITYYIAKHYPSLLPSSHKEEITALLAGLHDLNFFALSFGDEPVPATAKKVAIQEKLSRPGISERYRKALEDKKETIIQSERHNPIPPSALTTEIANAKTFLEKIAKLYNPSSSDGGWLWGRESASVLDVHVIVFLARLYDAGREGVIPERLGGLYIMAVGTEEWEGVFRGRRTMVGV